MTQSACRNHQATTSRQAATEGLDVRFLKRTFVATMLTMAFVALMAAVYWSPFGAACYLAAAVWALVFFASTAMILNAFLFRRCRLAAVGWIALKLGWLALAVVAGCWWLGDADLAQGTAVIAGVSTPLIVLVLRTVGAKGCRDNPTVGFSQPPDLESQP